ncbi:MAG: hypothetical protein OEY93_05680 [Anaerolineae bacterium]|nr:hypothetical protein [Anaerolineae bacterium]
MADKIMTQHPDPSKQGVNIDLLKYNQMRDAILAVLSEFEEITFKELLTAVSQRLPDFQGAAGWYITVVKLDLEARGEIKRIANSSPQRLQLKK